MNDINSGGAVGFSSLGGSLEKYFKLWFVNLRPFWIRIFTWRVFQLRWEYSMWSSMWVDNTDISLVSMRCSGNKVATSSRSCYQHLPTTDYQFLHPHCPTPLAVSLLVCSFRRVICVNGTQLHGTRCRHNPVFFCIPSSVLWISFKRKWSILNVFCVFPN